MAGVLYQPAGRAQEYAESEPGRGDGYAVNLFKGCVHGCKYCYVPQCPPWRFKENARTEFHRTVSVRENCMQSLLRELKRVKGLEGPVHLCFTCYPYPPAIELQMAKLLGAKEMPFDLSIMTRHVLRAFERNELKNVQVLTKGGCRACRDFDLLKDNDWSFGTSLVFANDALRLQWEPGAAAVEDREWALREAHQTGIRTWISLEPVIDPDEALRVIRRNMDHVGHWKIGKLNHGEKISDELGEIERSIDWRQFRRDVEHVLSGRSYLMKKSLMEV